MNSQAEIDPNPLKILLATYWYLPHVGGVSNYVDLLRNEFMARGHHVDVLSHTPDMKGIYMLTSGRYVEKSLVKDYVYENVLEFYNRELPMVEPWVRWREIERYTYELCALLFNLGGYDVIHTQDIISTRALARIRGRNTAHVATIHGLLATEHIASGEITSKSSVAYAYARAEEYFGCTSAHYTVVPAEWLRQRMSEEFGVHAHQLQVVPYGMDLERFHRETRRTPSRIPSATGQVVILCPARMVAVKGHSVLFDALSRMPMTDPFVLWLAGSGPLEQDLRHLAGELNLTDRVAFLGDRDDVPALMRRADIVVLPSIQDTLPFTIMEAQVSGRPVVATRAGGIPEMIDDGMTGMLVEPGDPHSLTVALRQLVENVDMRRRLGQEAQNRAVETWAPGPMADQLLGIYRRARAQVA